MLNLDLETKIKLDAAAIKSPNLADRFSKTDLQKIGIYVSEGYERDKASRFKWEQRMEAAMDLALQLQTEKSFPWQGAANVAFPLITIAALQFHSRAYPTLISGTDLVKMRVVGPDEDGSQVARAERVGRHMSFQCLEEDHAWEEQHDRLLINLPIIGCGFVKSGFDPITGVNYTDFVPAKDLVVDYYSRSIESASRKTHVLRKFRNEIYEKVKSGAYVDCLESSWYKEIPVVQESAQAKDKRTGVHPPAGDADTPFTCLEQHCNLDLDGDGYAEPYIVLVEAESQFVLRITTRFDREADIIRNARKEIISIIANEHFTKYSFIPSPDGGIYDLGFGILLGPLNESVNTLVNQLIDAGSMSILGGGFLGRGAKIRGGTLTFSPMEWKRVDSTGDDLRKSIVPLQTPPPSDVLFKLLGLLIDYTNRISGATEMLAGQNPGQNTAATTSDHMVEQGMKIYGAIFKRVWRGMKEEFKKLYVLNGIFMNPTKVLGPGVLAVREDYLGDPNRVCPVADPNVVSDQMRIAQAQFVAGRAMTVAGYDPSAVEKHLLKASGIDGWETLYVGVEKTGPKLDPKFQIAQLKDKLERDKLAQKRDEFMIEMMEQHDLIEAQIQQLGAMAEKLAAEAKGVDVGHQIAMIDAMIGAQKARKDELHSKIKLMLEAGKVQNEHEAVRGQLASMGSKPGHGGAAGKAA